MAIFKCKMCGGTLEINENQTTATCEYCGTQQTLPKLDTERRSNLYDRANHFRRNNEFDKAMSIYESILDEDVTDAEAYWSLVLCRYGIEYVEDPGTRKRIPTVNRAQFTSIFDDDNYRSALQYADGYQKMIYEQEANTINEIQKGILAISQKEEPFDVFICYKETDNNGRRTQDSVLANDLYHQLTNEGFKVFFARITLEDKLGVAYEPYIFAALNSAKVMVVLGTKPEYFNAVWVKNEWSRYLALVKESGGKKIIIPAYRDMDAYDLPEEFSHLQAQDMSKLGFMQDLIRGIKKLTQVDATKTIVQETVVANNGNANIASLLKRAFMYLEDEEWSSADEYCEKVLDQEPENAEAYLGKLMAELHIRKREALGEQLEPFDENKNYQKVLRFADEKLKTELVGYIEDINTRNENARLEDIYNQAKKDMEFARKGFAGNGSIYKKTASIFESLGDYRDSAALVAECYEKAEIARKDSILYEATSKISEKAGVHISSYEAAIKLLESISGWKNADEQIQNCKKRIEELKAEEEAERLERIERERQAEIARVEAERRIKRKEKIAIRVSIIVCAIAIYCTVIIPNQKYNAAIALMEDGKVVEAYEAFIALDGYKDSAEKAGILYTDVNIENLKTAKIGDYVYWGRYEQDNSSNERENIKWLVLDKKEEKLLVISQYALDSQKYNTYAVDVTWETCTLRRWLNNDFINAAFSNEEKEKISTVTVSADKNPKYNTNPGNATQDKIFLLSVNEANQYFSSDSARECKPTAYASGVNVYKEACWWWLRSPGYTQDMAATVDYYGSVHKHGYKVDNVTKYIRPAMWIDLN